MDYSGQLSCPIPTPWTDSRKAGDAVRVIAYADGYQHQTIVDTQNLQGEITESLNLIPMPTNGLIVHTLVFSTQHSTDYISVDEYGTTIDIVLNAYYAQSMYRRCRVSLIIDHDGPYDVNIPDYAIYVHEKTLGENTDIGYVQYSLEEDSTFEQFTVTNGTITYTINVTIKRVSSSGD